MTRSERFLLEAEKEAATVDYRWRLGSVAALGGRVLSRGKNRRRHDPAIHPLQATFHAEDVLIRRLAYPKGR